MEPAPLQGTVSAAGTDLAFLRVGAGDPVVVMPGGPRFGYAHLRPGFDLLAEEQEVIYYDERGSGASPVGDRDLVTTAGTLSDLDALLDGLAITRATLAGHSLAAHMVALYAATRPERVRALVLVHPGPPLVPELMEQFGKEMASRRLPGDADEIRQIEESPQYAARDLTTLEHYYRLYYAPFFRERENALAADYGFTQITAENVIGTAGRLFSDFGEHDLPGRLGTIACPTLVVHGELDPIPVESSRFIADAIPAASLLVISNANHFSFIEDSERFAAAVEPFLAEHRSG
jgi:proline iminopeptidase